MLDIARKEIIPAVSSYIRNLSETAIAKKQLITDADCEVETALVSKLSTLSSVMFRKIDSLNDALLEAKNYTDPLKVARFYKDTVLTAMQEVRVVADEMEMLTDSSCWPFPPYGELLFKT